MKLIEFNWQPSDRQLRQFAFIGLFAFPLVAWLWGGSTNVIGTCALIGFVLVIAAAIAPRLIKPLFIGAMIVAMPIGLVVSEVAMLIIYFGIFLPFGCVFRILGRDALKRGLEKHRESYWEPKQQPKNVASYYRQS